MCNSLLHHGLQQEGFSVLHSLPELAQTHVHWVTDAIQPSHPLSSLFLLPSIFLSIRVFSSESVLRIRWPKYWSFSFSISPSDEYSRLISFKTDSFPFRLTLWSLCCPRDSQESSPTPQIKSVNSSVLSFLYSPALTYIHDYWKNRRFDYTDLHHQSDVSAV